MAFKFPPAFFVTGTDTDVGKTFVSAVLMSGLRGHYWKPIQSGSEPCTDTEWIQQKTNLPKHHFFPEAYKLKNPLSPHLAAQLDGISIDPEKIKLPTIKESDHLIVEGAGGIKVPVNDSFFVIDLIKHLNLPALVVTRSTLGTINHTLLTLEKLRQNNIAILGVIMNGPKNEQNRIAIEKYGQVAVLAEIEPITEIDADNLGQLFKDKFRR